MDEHGAAVDRVARHLLRVNKVPKVVAGHNPVLVGKRDGHGVEDALGADVAKGPCHGVPRRPVGALKEPDSFMRSIGGPVVGPVGQQPAALDGHLDHEQPRAGPCTLGLWRAWPPSTCSRRVLDA